MIYRAYLRDQHQRVTDKTVTGDRAAALVAFENLVNRSDLDGQKMMAVLTCANAPVAHHYFNRPTPGEPGHEPSKYWRGKIQEIKWEKV